MTLFSKTISCAVGAVLLSTVATTEAKAISLFINNSSFETTPSALPLADGQATTSIPGWTGGGLYNPPSSVYSSVPDGNLIAYSNGGSIYQTLSATIQGGFLYTLSVFVGNRPNLSFGGYTASLYGNTRSNILASGTGAVPADGQFIEFNLSYAPSDPSVIGQQIGILFNTGGVQTNFDNVTLQATPIPFEFSPSFGLLTLGALWGSSRLYKRMASHKE